jgi:hypothetical protein
MARAPELLMHYLVACQFAFGQVKRTKPGGFQQPTARKLIENLPIDRTVLPECGFDSDVRSRS